MRGESQEVSPELPHVEGHVGDGLRGVDHHVGAVGVSGRGELCDGVLHAEHVGDMAAGDDLGRRADLGGDLAVGDLASGVGVEVDELRAGLAADLLPGDEVGVVRHDGDGNLVAGLEHVRGKALGYDVQGFARVAAKDDLVGAGATALVHGADELGDLGADLRDGLGRLDGERVQAAQRVGVHRLIEGLLRLEHAGGTLSGGAAVQEGEFGVLSEQREVALEGIEFDIDARPATADLVGSIEDEFRRSRAGVARHVLGVDHAISSSKCGMIWLPRRTTLARTASLGACSAASSSFAERNRASVCSWERPRHAA